LLLSSSTLISEKSKSLPSNRQVAYVRFLEYNNSLDSNIFT
jgi:hypothetical protein